MTGEYPNEKNAIHFISLVFSAARLFSQSEHLKRNNRDHRPVYQGCIHLLLLMKALLSIRQDMREAMEPIDIYPFMIKNGIWSKGKSLGREINSSEHEGNAFVTSDGKYLIFSRGGDIYWILRNNH